MCVSPRLANAAHDSCLVLSESGLKVYTNLNFVEKKKNHRHFFKLYIVIYKAKKNLMTKNNSKKSPHISTNDASGVQVNKQLSRSCLKNNKMT